MAKVPDSKRWGSPMGREDPFQRFLAPLGRLDRHAQILDHLTLSDEFLKPFRTQAQVEDLVVVVLGAGGHRRCRGRRRRRGQRGDAR